MVELLTTAQAAGVIGVSERRVRQMIDDGTLRPEGRLGRWYIVTRDEADRVARLPKSDPRGRPRAPRPAREGDA